MSAVLKTEAVPKRVAFVTGGMGGIGTEIGRAHV